MANIIDRLAGKISTFLDSRLIFLLDCVNSLAASLLALLALGYVRGTFYASGRFALIWMLSSLAAFVIAMLVFKGHKLIIRHLKYFDMICCME